MIKKRKRQLSDDDEFASSHDELLSSPQEDSDYVVGESHDGGDQVSSVREESLASSPSSEESSEMQEAIILSDNEGVGVQQAVKRKSSTEVEDYRRPKKQEKPKISPSAKVLRTKVEEPNQIIYSPKRLLINVKVPARVENQDKVIDLLGGQAHLSKVIK